MGNQINCPQIQFLKWLRTGIDNCDIHRLKSILHGFLKLAWKGNFREDKVDLTSIFFNFSLVVVFLTNSECHFWQGSRWIQPDSMAPDNDRYCIIWAKAKCDILSLTVANGASGQEKVTLWNEIRVANVSRYRCSTQALSNLDGKQTPVTFTIPLLVVHITRYPQIRQNVSFLLYSFTEILFLRTEKHN